MPIKIVKRYSVQDTIDHPDWLFVFGDNLIDRAGKGGQAIIRDSPNAVGIATKLRPSMDDAAFFSDKDFNKVQKEFERKFNQLYLHLQGGGTVVFPSDGIGTGLASLETKAPKIWEMLQLYIKALFDGVK